MGSGTIHFFLVLSWVFVLLLFQYKAFSGESYLQDLKAKARELSLSEEPQWLRLGHYRTAFFGGYVSDVVGGYFFLSEDGRYNPRAELEATLDAIFFEDVDPKEKPHPQCRFPARFHWLKEKLNIDSVRILKTNCIYLDQFLRKLGAESATLVFSSYYMNNPSSVFGHTLLRINRESPGRRAEDERQELLDHGINFAARVSGDENPVVYMFSGVFGLFHGSYSNVPYYYKVREYNDYESRDLWSYDLNLSPSQLQMLVNHLWELGGAFFRYYYFTQNCSYQILTALEAVDPSYDLVSRIPFYVIPADTVKSVVAEPGLIRRVTYRPSIRVQFNRRVDQLDESERGALRYLVDTKNPTDAVKDLHIGSKIRVLDSALDHTDFKHPETLIDKNDEKAIWRQTLLSTRARVLGRSEELKFDPPEATMPHSSHGSRRFGFSSGSESEVGSFSNLQMRFSLHDMLDPEAGYPRRSQIEFFNATVRYEWARRNFNLEEFTLLRALSFSPITTFIRDMSWGLEFGVLRILDRNCDRCLAGRLLGSYGPAWSLDSGDSFTVFAVFEAESAYSPAFFGSNMRLGSGPALGFWWSLAPSMKALFKSGYRYEVFSFEPHNYLATAGLRWGFTKRFAADFGVERHPVAWLGRGGVFYYF